MLRLTYLRPALLGCLLVFGACSDSTTTGQSGVTIPLDVTTFGLDGMDFSCGDDECQIDDVCYFHRAVSPESTCMRCDVLSHRTAWTPIDAEPCEDANLCLLNAVCQAGTCVGEAALCDDGDPCSLDSCEPSTGECTSEPSEGGCEDGDPCTVADTCVAGSCVSGDLDPCDDGQSCTVGACSPGSGCAFQPIEVGPCDDGDACTINDVCEAGVCTPEGPRLCDDGSVCTADSCDPTVGCVNTAYDSLCDDANPCTDDGCDVVLGCFHHPHTEVCDDGDACTEADACLDGACAGIDAVLDDGNPCTDDACDATDGVSHALNVAPCDDGDACSVGDVCEAGVCAVGAEPLDCDDASVCTTDSCNPDLGCVYDVALTCDDGNACTTDNCDSQLGCVAAVKEIDACRPQILVITPPRGATLLGDEAAQYVEVAGSVTSNGGPIVSLTLNGIPIETAPNGTFGATVPVFVGGNTLVLEAEDALGTPRKRVQSFHWSPAYYKEEEGNPDARMADPGAAIFLSPALNGKLGEVFEAVLAGFDIAQFIPNPVTEEPVTSSAGLGDVSYMLYLAGCPASESDCCSGGTCYDFFNTSAPTVEITSIEGGLAVKAVIANISAGIWGDRTGCSILGCLAPAPLVGTMTIEAITIEATLSLSVTPDHEIDVTLTEVEASFTGVSVDIDHWTAFIIEGLINDQVGDILGDVEDEFANQMDETLAPMVSDALGALAFEAEFPLPGFVPGAGGSTLKIFTDFADVDAGADGMLFELRAGAELVLMPGEVAVTTPWDDDDHLGTVARSACATGLATSLPVAKSSPLELLLGDDTMNLLLHGAWEGGFLEFDLPPEVLGDVDLTQYGVENLEVTVSGMLPPVLSDCYQDTLKLHMGDLRIDASMQVLGKQVDVVMYLTLSADFAFSVSDAGISFGVTEIDTFDHEVTVQQGDLIAFESIIGDLITQDVMPQLLGQLSVGDCDPTEVACDPACAENSACGLDASCACDTGTFEEAGSCVLATDPCEMECPGSALCVAGADGAACACKLGFGGASCHDCSPGFTMAGGLAAFPLPEIDFSGGAADSGIQIVPFESDHANGFTIIHGDLQ